MDRYDHSTGDSFQIEIVSKDQSIRRNESNHRKEIFDQKLSKVTSIEIRRRCSNVPLDYRRCIPNGSIIFQKHGFYPNNNICGIRTHRNNRKRLDRLSF